MMNIAEVERRLMGKLSGLLKNEDLGLNTVIRGKLSTCMLFLSDIGMVVAFWEV
jgi:hypothetical protein